MRYFLLTTLIWGMTLGHLGGASAMQQDGCGAGSCRDCHSLNREEATELLQELPLEIIDVDFSEVPGLWVVDVQNRQGRRAPVYVDFSKQYIFSGNIMNLATKEDVTGKRMAALNPIDPSVIPLDDALVLGDPDAKYRIIVFDDPECKFCRKLHPEMKRMIDQRNDVAFYIKLFPLNQKSSEKARAIVCAQSMELLESSLAGKAIPPADCKTDQIEKNIAVGQSIGVRSTPTLVLPDGRVVPGFKTVEQLTRLLDPDTASER
jgi:thiol:disulfide interchange protein DsbC